MGTVSPASERATSGTEIAVHSPTAAPPSEMFMCARRFPLSVLVKSASALILFLLCEAAFAKVVVFWQPGFPTIGSQPVSKQALTRAFADLDFVDAEQLNRAETLGGASLLVLPYGSALPLNQWHAIQSYLQGGGNLLVLGGQPFQVPVKNEGGVYRAQRPQDTFARAVNFRHTYEV